MKLSVILFTAATALTAAYADDAPATVGPGPEATTAAPTTAPTSAGSSSTTTTPAKTTKTPSTTTSTPSATGAGNSNAAASTLDKLTQKASGYTYQMPYVRVVQARVQSDKPEWNKDRFVSTYGKGDRVKGYMSSMDTVNTASVEGALMYVQAEGINQNSRSADNRCIRKNNMNWVVLYEILIAQTNETIAQFENTWNVREYGPMIPMDGGQCTPLSGSTFPPECLQFNGDKGQPNVGPFIGAGLKNNDVRAPYPDNYWFSFPHTCPLKKWNDKIAEGDTCRASTRKGLCDIGVAPDGIECTFAYDILGWVPIDDVVGITSLTDDNGKAYGNFTQWCQASTKHIEFAGNDKTGEMTEGLDFWKDPLDATKNAARANKVIDIYQKITEGSFVSTQITADDVAHFKNLPDPADLAKVNPPCYKSVRSCNSGNGCERLGFSQICFPCDKASDTCKVDKAYTLPKLAKAPTTLSDSDLTSGSKLSDTTGANSNQNGTKTKSDATVATGSRAAAIATALAVGVAAVLAL